MAPRAPRRNACGSWHYRSSRVERLRDAETTTKTALDLGARASPRPWSYLAALPEHLDEVFAKDLYDVQIEVLGDVAVAFFTSRSSVKLKGLPTRYEPVAHVSVIFRRTSEGWRLIHFHESARSAQAAQVMQAMQAG